LTIHPDGVEWLVPLLLWSGVFELVLPSLDSFRRLATADPLDILFYTLGAALAALVWRLYYGDACPAPESNG